MLEQKREEATAVLLMMMIDDEDDKEWKSEGREVGSRSVKIVNWEEERVVSQSTTFFQPWRRYPQSYCSLERSGRVIGCLSRPTQKPQVGGWRVAGGVGSPHQQTSYDESKREGF